MPSVKPLNQDSITEAVQYWRDGHLVAFGTETVYGLGADAGQARAVSQIFATKQRPQFNPLISHVASLDAAFRLGIETELADILARSFWPGPLTLVLNRQPDCPVALLTTAGLDKIAVRVPANKHAQRLLQICDMPIAAPSANQSGRISPSTADHVNAGLAGKIDLILDGGPCEDGLESTIIDCSGAAPVLLRPGGIARGAIETALQSAGVTVALIDAQTINKQTSDSQTGDPQQPVAPGQLRSHYAPEAGVRLNATIASATEELIGFGPVAGAGQLAMSFSQTADLREAATNLFAMLHQADAVTAGTGRTIAIAPIPDDGIGEAINDRLRRAAAPRD